MPPRIDRTGERFGLLIAIADAGSKNGVRVWRCKCDCGNERLVRANKLVEGVVTSCGCHVSLPLGGQRFGRLIAVRADATSSRRKWLCRCDCGNEVLVNTTELTAGKTRSCGCLRREQTAKANVSRTSHGLSRTPTYYVWRSMLQRCTNPKVLNWDDYGGRGIKVCQRWMTFENFLADMGERPSPKHSIDRYPNNDGNYERTNCRWATPKQQAANRRHRSVARANAYPMFALSLPG